MASIINILSKQPFLSGFESGHLQLMTGCASETEFSPGEYLFRQNEDANQFFLIQGGTVSLKIFAPSRGPVPIQTIGTNEALGWSWLIPPYKWHFDARALEHTQALAFDAECLRGKMEQDRNFGYQIQKRFIAVMAQRLQATRLQLLDVYGETM